MLNEHYLPLRECKQYNRSAFPSTGEARTDALETTDALYTLDTIIETCNHSLTPILYVQLLEHQPRRYV